MLKQRQGEGAYGASFMGRGAMGILRPAAVLFSLLKRLDLSLLPTVI